LPDLPQRGADADHHCFDYPGQRLIVAAGELHFEKEPRGSFFRCSGFSIAELIAVIVIVSIISVIAMANFSGGLARTRGFYDELLSQVQYARKVAVAQRRSVFVRIDAGQSRLCYSSGGTCAGPDAVASPTGSAPFTVAAPAGVTVIPSTLSIQFDGLGRYPAGGPLTVAVSGDGDLQFTVENETGYVRP
jgi:MSHA pilin protein MshC